MERVWRECEENVEIVRGKCVEHLERVRIEGGRIVGKLWVECGEIKLIYCGKSVPGVWVECGKSVLSLIHI